MSEDRLPSAMSALHSISAQEMSVRDYLERCLARIDDREAELYAFASIDREGATRRADELDRSNADAGMLRGVPVAVKDVIDTSGMPTEYGSPLYAGHRPARDAACVSILRCEGAIILGKAQTVEFASLGRVADTRNPRDPERTPGGSSSGSAAAVAAGMVPLALATQTGGSTIRPAAFCGVAGMKPTFGTVPVEGMKPYAPSLDTIGWMARSVEDLGLLARVFRTDRAGDDADGDVSRIGFYRTPYWEAAAEETRHALADTIALLRGAGIAVEEVEGPEGAELLNEAQDVIMHGEGRAAFLAEYLRRPEELHREFVDEVENSRGIDAARLRWAHDYLGEFRPRFDEAMAGYDAWLVPAVPGVAPRGLASTGDAVFNRLWTGLHVPAVTLPGMESEQGLPVGIQLVAPRYADTRLLAAARIVEALIAANS